jgi:hypothetical protein
VNSAGSSECIADTKVSSNRPLRVMLFATRGVEWKNES